MKQTVTSSFLVAMFVPLLMAGCSESERLVKVATEAADRQAEQNTEMADLNREVAQGTRRLVEVDAEARQDIIEVHHDLQAERAALSDSFDSLESERKEIAEQRQTESLLVLAANGVGILFVAAIITSFCLALLRGHSSNDESDATLNELLIHDLVSEHPRLLNKSIARAAPKK